MQGKIHYTSHIPLRVGSHLRVIAGAHMPSEKSFLASPPEALEFSHSVPPREDSEHHLDRQQSNRFASVSPSSNSSLITLGLSSVVAAGVQFGWALQLSLLTPYIQTLGIEHAFASFIWLCGPITGFVVQPCVGVWSDNCKLRLGRRRPFILAGALLICFAVTIIGFAADIGYLLGDSHEDCKVYKGVRPRAVGVLILGFWLLDLANNTVQGPARALLADLAGPHQRDTANAMFCLWMALGNILGFSAGSRREWYRLFPFLTSKACCEACGNLKAAFIVAVVCLIFCTLVTLFFAREIPLPSATQIGDAAPLLFSHPEGSVELQAVRTSSDVNHNIDGGMNGNADFSSHMDLKEDESTVTGPGAVLVNLLTSVRQLPSEMRSVLLVMGLCWLSWFPFFLFDTDWMGREVFQGNPLGDPAKVVAYQNGVQRGAYGLLLNSVVLAIGSFLIDPFCRWIGSKYVWAISNFIICICMASTAIVSALAVREEKAGVYTYAGWAQFAAVALFALLGLPLAITFSVPYSITAELAADSGGGKGLAMGILNLAVVIPQMVVALGAGPWDGLFGGGNEPAFGFAAVFAFAAGIVSVAWLPQLSKGGYRPAGSHGFG